MALCKTFAPVAAMVSVASHAGAPADLTKPDIANAIQQDYDRNLAGLFEWLHQNPELSFQEHKTAARLANELREINGIIVTEQVGGTGIVGVLRNGQGPTVLVRADIDGLPVEENSGVVKPSKVRQRDRNGVEQPVMHACGHDVHMTSLVATARQMAAMSDRWSGTLIFVAQPAEEIGGGAKAMLADGLYTRFAKPDYALAMHVAAEIPAGTITAAETTQYSSVDSLDITVRGVATHGASPQLGRDPVYIASQIVIAMQGIIGRERPPLDPGLITVGAFHAGSKHNIISDKAELQLTLRTNDPATRELLLTAIARTAKHIAAANGVPDDLLPIIRTVSSAPVTANDPVLARRLLGAIARNMGPNIVVPWRQTDMGAEDFAHLVAPEHNVKGFYFAVGGTPKQALDAAGRGGPAVAGHHSPFFKIDPRASVTDGATAMTVAAMELLQRN